MVTSSTNVTSVYYERVGKQRLIQAAAPCTLLRNVPDALPAAGVPNFLDTFWLEGCVKCSPQRSPR